MQLNAIKSGIIKRVPGNAQCYVHDRFKCDIFRDSVIYPLHAFHIVSIDRYMYLVVCRNCPERVQ